MWGLERLPNAPKWIPWKSWCTKVLSSVGFSHGQVGRCTTAELNGLVGSFVKNWNSWFLRCEGWKGLQMSPNQPIEVFVHESFECGGFCTTAELDGLVGSFVKNWNLWFLRCEGWKGLQISPNEYHESPGARNFWVQWVLHRAKLVGAPQYS